MNGPIRFIVSIVALCAACGDPADAAIEAIDDVALSARIAAQARLHAGAPLPARGLPIVLVHGMAGFKPVAKWFDYFFRVRDAIAQSGHRVFCAQTDPFQTPPVRARQLAVQVDEVLRLTGAPRVHLIAHSQGGLDARYLVTSLGYGDRIDALVTVATPHHGVQLVDMALRWVPAWVARTSRIVKALSDGLLGGNADLVEQLHHLSKRYVTCVFNPNNPDDGRVRYYSYAGQTQSSPFVNMQRIDVVHPLLLTLHRLVDRVEGDNDGVVPIRSAQWGTYLGSVPADHWDEIGQPPSVPHFAFNHLDFYTALATFLQDGSAPPQY